MGIGLCRNSVLDNLFMATEVSTELQPPREFQLEK